MAGPQFTESGISASFEAIAAKEYERAKLIHGDLELGAIEYYGQLFSATQKVNCSSSKLADSVTALQSLNTTDLYLTTACGYSKDSAWRRFETLYGHYIKELVSYTCSSKHIAIEIRQSISAHLFLPDRSGHSRMFSYDGRSSLATWLRVIVVNRIINEGQRKCNASENVQPLDSLPDIAALVGIEHQLKYARYHNLLLAAVCKACRSLQPTEKDILLLRFDKQIQLGVIAKQLGVHQSTITRMIDRIVTRFRESILQNLRSVLNDEAATLEALSLLREDQWAPISIIDHLVAERSVLAVDQRRCSAIPAGETQIRRSRLAEPHPHAGRTALCS